MSNKRKQTRSSGFAPEYGLLAEYETTAELIHAAERVRDAGYKSWDTFTPFPVHGIDPAMGIRPTRLPWIVLGAGITGCAVAVWMQWYMNAYDYAWIVSGKPFWSIPANIPVAFEVTVLFSALTALAGMLLLNKLPWPSSPLDLSERFARATDDRFFLVVRSEDPKYDPVHTKELLEGTDPEAVEVVPEDTRTSGRMPRLIPYSLAVIIPGLAIPFAVAALARASTSDTPRIHLVSNMDKQDYLRPQAEYAFFEDGRADRPQVPGTVGRGQLQADDHFYKGLVDGTPALTFPPQVAVNEATMARGQERFNVFCAPCHGLTGAGNGLVSERALSREQAAWVMPTDVRLPYLYKQPVGTLFGSIANGVRNMPAYGSQLPAADRWAVVLYLRALQRTQNSNETHLRPGQTLE